MEELLVSCNCDVLYQLVQAALACMEEIVAEGPFKWGQEKLKRHAFSDGAEGYDKIFTAIIETIKAEAEYASFDAVVARCSAKRRGFTRRVDELEDKAKSIVEYYY